jgi:hypothetical protein
MFPFRLTVPANDITINEYVKAASHFGIQDVNWTYEWADGGRAIFAFDTEERKVRFKCLIWLHQISN